MTASRYQHYQPLQHAGHASSRLAQSLRSISWPQRKLFLLVFLWTCVCLVVFKTSLLSGGGGGGAGPGQVPSGEAGDEYADSSLRNHHLKSLAARSAASLRPALRQQQKQPQMSTLSLPALTEILAPEFDLPSASSGSSSSDASPHFQYKAAGSRSHLGPSSSAAPSQANVILSSFSSSSAAASLASPSMSEVAAAGSNSERQWSAAGAHGSPQQVSSSSSSTGAGEISDEANAKLQTTPTTSHQTSTTTSKHKASTAAHPKAARKSAHLPESAGPLAGDQCHYSYPNLFDLQFNNIHWQKLVSLANGEQTASGGKSAGRKQATFYLYNAYYDDRWRAGLPSVRVLAMIDRVAPPPTNCLLWPRGSSSASASKPLVTRAQFVYAWYPKWGNYEDGILQPWIVTCPLAREHAGLVPESVSLVDVPAEMKPTRDKRDAPELPLVPPSFSSSSSASSVLGLGGPGPAPPHSAQETMSSRQHSVSSSSSGPSGSSQHPQQQQQQQQASTSALTTTPLASQVKAAKSYDCKSIGPIITNNLPVFNRRPPGGKRDKFAVCVKGLDFPFDEPGARISIRLVEWIEMLNLLGAKKIFLYELNVHENISKVLNYYQKRGLVELSPLTLPGDQPNLPAYQHAYLKQKLTSKRQNELIPYNDCLYRNLHSYEYLALLDIDEVIMPLKEGHTTWYDLMGDVERMSRGEQNYSRASYNVRNVYFFDDLSGPLGTTQANTQPLGASSSPSAAAAAAADEHDDEDDEQADAANEVAPDAGSEQPSKAPGGGGGGAQRSHRDSAERGIPHYLHMMSHVYRSKNYTEPGQYVKCFHNTERVVSLHNHFPMNCFGQCTTYSIPLDLAHLQHYRKDCVGPLRQSCKNDFRLFTTRDTTIWRYKQRMIRRTTRVLNQLNLLAGSTGSTGASAAGH